ncbi:MAG TPA: hypothetical protein VG826_05725 [Pirellulales bacterium]|nr:hypothetical protein [Pirellulales bacterium]
MRLSFEVGQREKHQVEFRWEKFLGVAKIWVDGELIQKSRPLALQEVLQLSQLSSVTGSANYLAGMMNGSGRPDLITGWSFEVGRQERHVVYIQKERPQILAAFRAHTYRVFVDDDHVRDYVG